MSESISLVILKEIVARLNVGRPTGVPEFSLLKMVPTDSDDHPDASVYPSTEPVRPATNRGSKTSIRTLNAVIEVRAKGASPIEKLDLSKVWITSVLGGVRLSTSDFPQLSNEISEENTRWRVAQREVPFMAIFVELEIQFATPVRDQTRTTV